MGFLETLRRWVDGDEGEDALSRAAAEQARPRRQAEQFIAQIARSIGEVMNAEAVPLPPDQTVIPPEYIVYISDDDDREWQGIKRKALEQGLYHVLAEHARDLAGKTKLATNSFSVELRVDGTLGKGEIRVQHSWEESSSSNKTSITPRRQDKQQPQVQPQNQTQQGQKPVSAPLPTPLPNPSDAVTDVNKPRNTSPLQYGDSQLAPTIIGTELNAPPAEQQNQSVEEATRVAPRPQKDADSDETRVAKRELYRLEVWRDNQRQAVIPVFKEEVSIGRKSAKISSDIQLEGDPEISRPHAILRRDKDGKLWLIHKGKNPTILNGREIAPEQPVPLTPGEPIAICSYLLRVVV